MRAQAYDGFQFTGFKIPRSLVALYSCKCREGQRTGTAAPKDYLSTLHDATRSDPDLHLSFVPKHLYANYRSIIRMLALVKVADLIDKLCGKPYLLGLRVQQSHIPLMMMVTPFNPWKQGSGLGKPVQCKL